MTVDKIFATLFQLSVANLSLNHNSSTGKEENEGAWKKIRAFYSFVDSDGNSHLYKYDGYGMYGKGEG
ncbi:MAG: hypothetical protein WD599_01075 [Balneolaceae bacterium]